jgi:hypothetical protein
MGKSAYQQLGLMPRLILDEVELREAFREAGRRTHPDGGGDPAAFDALRTAHDTLASPACRLRHWLECRGVVVDTRGAVDSGLMDLFGRVGDVARRAGELARQRSSARSALVLAMSEAETQLLIEAVESTIAEVDGAITRETVHFAEWESAEAIDGAQVSRHLRNLLFLEKWRATLRGLVPTLV